MLRIPCVFPSSGEHSTCWSPFSSLESSLSQVRMSLQEYNYQNKIISGEIQKKTPLPTTTTFVASLLLISQACKEAPFLLLQFLSRRSSQSVGTTLKHFFSSNSLQKLLLNPSCPPPFLSTATTASMPTQASPSHRTHSLPSNAATQHLASPLLWRLHGPSSRGSTAKAKRSLFLWERGPCLHTLNTKDRL